jgi:hypothetical protein
MQTILVAVAFIVLFALCLNVLVSSLVWLSIPAGVIATNVIYR